MSIPYFTTLVGMLYVAKITASGGTVVAPKMAVPSIGYFAYCQDTEGNTFGVMQSDPSAA